MPVNTNTPSDFSKFEFSFIEGGEISIGLDSLWRFCRNEGRLFMIAFILQLEDDQNRDNSKESKIQGDTLSHSHETIRWIRFDKSILGAQTK